MVTCLRRVNSGGRSVMRGWQGDLALFGAPGRPPAVDRPARLRVAIPRGRGIGRGSEHRGDLHHRRTGHLRRTAMRVRVGVGSRVLRLVPLVVQGLECGDRRRQHLHVTAGRSDDLDGGGPEATYTLLDLAGATRRVSALDFTTGSQQNILHPGKLLRTIHLPATAMTKRWAFRRMSLTHLGRSSSLLIGTLDSDTSTFLLTVTAATTRPHQLRFDALPTGRHCSSAALRNCRQRLLRRCSRHPGLSEGHDPLLRKRDPNEWRAPCGSSRQRATGRVAG